MGTLGSKIPRLSPIQGPISKVGEDCLPGVELSAVRELCGSCAGLLVPTFVLYLHEGDV